MLEESPFQCHSDRDIVIVLPGEVPSERSTLSHPPATTPFTKVKDSGLETSSPIPSHLFHSSDCSPPRQLTKSDAFHVNVKRAHQTKFTSTDVVTPRQQRLRMWYAALKKKKQLVQQLLETQKLIEDVEQEASQYLARDTIALYRRRYYDVEIKDDTEGTFISAISAIRLDEKAGSR